jgi:hypothetical protein
MYKSRAQIIEQLNIIKEAIKKLRKTDKPRIQHALNIMMTLGRLTKLYATNWLIKILTFCITSSL